MLNLTSLPSSYPQVIPMFCRVIHRLSTG